MYILANFKNTTLYVGVTNCLSRRLDEHKKDLVDGFSKWYKTHKLVYYEVYDDIETAIYREKQIKGWKRDKKNSLISSVNPDLHDLSRDGLL